MMKARKLVPKVTWKEHDGEMIRHVGVIAEPCNHCKYCIYSYDTPYCEIAYISGNYDELEDREITCDVFEEYKEEKQPEYAIALTKNVEQLGQYVAQMGKLMAAMQRRMDELEARQARVTVSHGDVKRIRALIRMRADEICGRYDLRDRDSARIFRAAIKKDILKRYQVKDLHDVPEAMLPAVENQVTRWADIRLVMERRAEA